MIRKILGNTGISVPAIIQGASGMGSYSNTDPEKVKKRIEAIKYGLELGMNYLDTADLYGGGFSEEIVAKIIRGKRHEIFLATKFNPGSDVAGSIFRSIEGSLKRLQTDYVDLYQLHWPNPLLSLSEIMNALDRLVDQGKIRFIGLSNFSLAEFKEAQSFLTGNKIVSNQAEYNLLDRSVEQDLLPFCRDNSVTLIAYSALNGGRYVLGKQQKSLLAGLSERYQKSVPQIILRWLISHGPVIVTTRSGGMEHTGENALSADFVLDEEDINKINETRQAPSVQVPTNKIRIKTNDRVPVYLTMQEALDNRQDLIPSPLVLSKIILKRNQMKPIRLKLTEDIKAKYEYDIDSYDIRDNVKKYWAWIIAFGSDRKIPAMIVN